MKTTPQGLADRVAEETPAPKAQDVPRRAHRVCLGQHASERVKPTAREVTSTVNHRQCAGLGDVVAVEPDRAGHNELRVSPACASRARTIAGSGSTSRMIIENGSSRAVTMTVPTTPALIPTLLLSRFLRRRFANDPHEPAIICARQTGHRKPRARS